MLADSLVLLDSLTSVSITSDDTSHSCWDVAVSAKYLACCAICALSYAAGASVEKIGEAAACAVKRLNLDMRMAYAARKAGAELRENFEVDAADFDAQQGLWTVTSKKVSIASFAFACGQNSKRL